LDLDKLYRIYPIGLNAYLENY